MKPTFSFVIPALATLAGSLAVGAVSAQDATSGADVVAPIPLTPKERLGKVLFFDTGLSEPAGQSCASCHDPDFAFSDPDKWVPTSDGVQRGLFGKRNTPTAMYLADVPALQFVTRESAYVGGLFVDGRADSLKEQAKAPLLNPAEMANTDAATVVEKVRQSTSAKLFKTVYGPTAFSNVEQAFDDIAAAIAAFERTVAFQQYSSKYDAVLAGTATLTADELDGLFWFNNKCASCHPVTPNASKPPLISDLHYHNLGLPKNSQNRFYRMPPKINPDGPDFVDKGLGGFLGEAAQNGKFRTPSLRNVALTAPYMHNGWFNTLRGVVDFYNTRDRRPLCQGTRVTEDQAISRRCWPASEVSANRSEAIGKMDLSSVQVDHIVAFMKTLTDGWRRSLRF